MSAFLAAKKASIDVKNEDDESFKWSITRALNPVENPPDRIDKKLREISQILSLEEPKFPVNCSDINKSENHNYSMAVNVFCYEKLVCPLTISGHNYKRESTVTLLLFSDDTKQHYSSIKDISKLLS